MLDICIAGGGASAMAAAISAAGENPDLRIGILEKEPVLGRKLLATGNGKCNLSNAACPDVNKTLAFFSAMGILTRRDEQGRIYPYAEQAGGVVYGLERQIRACGRVQVRTGCPVTAAEQTKGGFRVDCGEGSLQARKLLIACGGKAGPQYGTTGDGYRLARGFGHTVTKTVPVLTGLETAKSFVPLKGIRAKGNVSLWKNDLELARETGEIQFTADGLSGICIFNLSRWIKAGAGEDYREALAQYRVAVDFLPAMSETQAEAFLRERAGLPGLACGDLLFSVLAGPLAKCLLEESGLDLRQPAKEASGPELARLARLLKDWTVEISGVKGWKTAQCTSGGVALPELNLGTMESKLVKGLYFAGEVIDFDGPCGGFNLQNAWETGIKAVKAMAHV